MECDAATADELEARAAALVEYGNSLPDGVTTEAFAEAENLRREARRLRDGVAATPQEEPMNLTQTADGRWVEAVPMRRATWLEVALDRWIGPRTGHPWRSVLKGILGRA